MFENPIVVLTVLALLPLIPAILLFKLLPGGNTEVEGPLAGLKVKLGGAFGGYVALTAFLATFYATSLKPAGSAMEEWTVVGDVRAGAGEITCKLSPPLSILPGNHFFWHISKAKGTELPSIVFEAPGFEGETLYLTKTAYLNGAMPIDIDDSAKIVRVKAPIVLPKKEAVAATAAAPAPPTAGGL
ncbi:MAG TPA: hypothetical protein VG323_04745 [Thermoanaerobaculia bacterium]|nr:hypothetical protein [Thermoanaerobaculia bacterium]